MFPHEPDFFCVREYEVEVSVEREEPSNERASVLERDSHSVVDVVEQLRRLADGHGELLAIYPKQQVCNCVTHYIHYRTCKHERENSKLFKGEVDESSTRAPPPARPCGYPYPVLKNPKRNPQRKALR